MTEQSERRPFRLEEATIDELHAAIRAGDTTCVEVVRRYIERARAYNGVASLLVTEDGGRIPQAVGTLPDALEHAAELDARYGRNPPLDQMPMYGVAFSFKDPFDTKDMRTTAGGDAAYDIDFPARDHILVEQLRDKGAIIFAKAVCTEY